MFLLSDHKKVGIECVRSNLAQLEIGKKTMLEKIRKFLDKFSSTSFGAYRLFRYLEIIFGFCPFEVKTNKQQKVKPSLKLFRVGLFFSIIHIFTYVTFCLVVVYVHPEVISIMNTNFAIIQSHILNGLHLINTFIIFIWIYASRKRSILVFTCIYKIDRNCHLVGFNLRTFYRKMTLYATCAFLFILIWLFTACFHGFYFWSKIIQHDLVLVYFTISVMPSVYMQLMLVQFCVAVLFLKARTDNLNRILMEVHRMECVNLIKRKCYF